MNLSTLQKELNSELLRLLGYWENHTIDHQYGGFAGKIDNSNNRDATSHKGSVLNARILWSFSAASHFLSNTQYTSLAKRAYDYIRDNFLDNEYGGVYWSVDFKGQPGETRKQVYAQAFTIYACSEYFKVTGDATAKAFAIELYMLLEKYSYDPVYGGYTEAFTREWKELDDLRLSEKDANEKKTMNTHLHVLEAYANLYSIWPESTLCNRIKELLDIFTDRIIDNHSGHLQLFFTDKWEVKGNIISYGHDIEAAWLLLEGAETIGDAARVTTFKKLAQQIAMATLAAVDSDGGIWYEQEGSRRVKEKHWWVQAEAMVGFFTTWKITGDDKYLAAVIAAWSFIKNRIMDKTNGEWYWGIDQHYHVMAEDKVGFWKCPYHNMRACIEVLKRIKLQ